MKDEDEKLITPQVQAVYGYAFSLSEKEDNSWSFDVIILDEQGMGASDELSLDWDAEKCTYKIWLGGD